MLQNLNFKDKKKLFVIVMRKYPNRGPQNWQKYILQQINVLAGKNLPYVALYIQGFRKIYNILD